jgi:NAD(P)H dehydrogenase (quinone)
VTKLAIIYYSTTGHGTTMAKRVAATAESAGAEVRVRHAAETHDPASFAQNPAWTANYEATKDLPAATGDDIVWADAVIFGTPTRFGSPAAQLRTFIDSLGGLWADGKLADKVYAGYTSSNTAHGGQETTLLSLYITLIHWGGIIVPPGYTDPCKFVDGKPGRHPRQHRRDRRRDQRRTRPSGPPGREVRWAPGGLNAKSTPARRLAEAVRASVDSGASS